MRIKPPVQRLREDDQIAAQAVKRRRPKIVPLKLAA